jgi:hypothetical protein
VECSFVIPTEADHREAMIRKVEGVVLRNLSCLTIHAALFEKNRRTTWPFHIQSPESSSTGRKIYLTLKA